MKHATHFIEVALVTDPFPQNESSRATIIGSGKIALNQGCEDDQTLLENDDH
jgi:hypothetical protein